MIQKIQYYPEDLIILLGIGEIKSMHIATDDDGVTVLRIEAETLPKKKDDYKTVRASKPVQPKSKKAWRDNYTPKNKNLNTERSVPAPDTGFGSKAANFGIEAGKGVIGWLRTPPRKRPDQW